MALLNERLPSPKVFDTFSRKENQTGKELLAIAYALNSNSHNCSSIFKPVANPLSPSMDALGFYSLEYGI